ncbi:hypothetical protein [Morganella morganii]|uniref:hypothetical protein n=1 Tax=Morganella morganii TaxID=582 RepID=UPI0023689FEF|nr:hypothetical protein [Morganella morganii]
MTTFNDNKGRFMNITYKDIQDRVAKVEEAKVERINRVTLAASTLVEKYTKSLNLESDAWQSIDGEYKPYVTTGKQFDANSYVTKPVSGLPLSESYSLDFDIATVIDDSPRGGDTVRVNINLWVNSDDVLCVRIDSAAGTYQVIDDCWDKVCDKIKDNVILAIEDPALKVTTYY